MNILIECDNAWSADIISKAVEATLKYEKFEQSVAIELLIVSKQQIKTLNRKTRNLDAITDVLSYPNFDSVEEMVPDETGFVFLGSMVICKEKACEQAREYGHSVEREVAFLAVHSTLHLLGYDHERSKKEEKIMFDKQKQILEIIGLKR